MQTRTDLPVTRNPDSASAPAASFTRLSAVLLILWIANVGLFLYSVAKFGLGEL
jgi:hypothetical protein